MERSTSATKLRSAKAKTRAKTMAREPSTYGGIGIAALLGSQALATYSQTGSKTLAAVAALSAIAAVLLPEAKAATAKDEVK